MFPCLGQPGPVGNIGVQGDVIPVIAIALDLRGKRVAAICKQRIVQPRIIDAVLLEHPREIDKADVRKVQLNSRIRVKLEQLGNVGPDLGEGVELAGPGAAGAERDFESIGRKPEEVIGQLGPIP